METPWKEIIEKRTKKLRSHLDKLTLVRDKLEFLKNYYKNKTAIIVAPGPGYKNHIKKIKDSINENTILICIKRSVRDFDMVCDFHVYNFVRFEEYKYKQFNPIIIYYYDYPCEDNKRKYKLNPKIVDIRMYRGHPTVKHSCADILRDCLDYRIDGMTWNDENLGEGEHISPKRRHIMFEQAIPIAVNTGCKTIILNGWVGGYHYGDKNIIEYLPNSGLKIEKEMESTSIWSSYLTNYLIYKFNINLYSICKTRYIIKEITYDEYDIILKLNWKQILYEKFEKLNKTKFLIYKAKWMEIIEERIQKLRCHLDKLSLVRDKLEFLKNYYKNKTAIIVAPGPGYRDHVEKIKNSINENTILICIKRTIRDFDMVCDFHVYNFGHYEEYYYKLFNPIVFFYYNFPLKSDPTRYNPDPDIVDIKMYRGIHNEKNRHINLLRDCHNLEYDGFTWNDENLGVGEMICPRRLHIMFEMAFPLAINIGCKNIILNGWVGGHTYGDPEIPKFTEKLIEKINKELEYAIEWSKHLSPYFLHKFDIDLYTICETKYHVKLINYEEYDNIIKFKI